MKTGCWVIATAVLAVAAPVAAQTTTPPVRATINGRAQVQYSTTSVDETEAGATASTSSNTFETRRIRLQFNVTAGEHIRAVVEPEFALARLQLKQAWIGIDLDSAITIRVGQFKKPFSAILLSSSTQIAPIERGVRIRGLNEALTRQETADQFRALRGELLVGEHYALLEAQKYADYDIGAAFEGERAGVGWSVGVFNGSGPDTRDENDAKTFAGRLTYRLKMDRPVRVGASFVRRDLNWPNATTRDTVRNGSAFEADLEVGAFRRPGLWLIAEAATGENIVTQETFKGGAVIASFFRATGGRHIEGIEPVARVSYGDPDDTVDDDAGILVTPGINLYFIGRNRLMFNWDVFMPRGDAFSTQHALRAQMNLYF